TRAATAQEEQAHAESQRKAEESEPAAAEPVQSTTAVPLAEEDDTDEADSDSQLADDEDLAEAEPSEPVGDIELSDADMIDDEIIEIFAEEAGEVLETINNYLPKFNAN